MLKVEAINIYDIKNKCSKSVAIKMWRWYNCSRVKGLWIGGVGMAKIVCESCETIFQYDVVKDMKVCPVCGKPLWEDAKDNENADSSQEVPSFGEGIKLGASCIIQI